MFCLCPFIGRLLHGMAQTMRGIARSARQMRHDRRNALRRRFFRDVDFLGIF
jgi:hypothetical protein